MKRIICVILFVPLLLLSSCQPAQTIQTGVVTIDPVELADFADNFFVKQMDKLDIPGVVFIFVQGNEVIYVSGGFSKKPWEIICQALEVEVIESALQGNMRCRFAIRLPETVNQ